MITRNMPLFSLHEASVPFTCTSIFKLSKTKNILLDILTRDYGFHLMQVQYFIERRPILRLIFTQQINQTCRIDTKIQRNTKNNNYTLALQSSSNFSTINFFSCELFAISIARSIT